MVTTNIKSTLHMQNTRGGIKNTVTENHQFTNTAREKERKKKSKKKNKITNKVVLVTPQLPLIILNVNRLAKPGKGW